MRGSDSLPHRLRRLRLLARFVLLVERGWPALWPAFGVAGLFACAALLDLPRRVPASLHAVVLLGAVGAFGWLLWRGLRAVRLPLPAEADRRLEQASGLRHRPLAVLSDRSMLAGTEGLWRAHVARAAAQIGRLRTGWPRTGIAARDPRALRAGLMVALVACLGVAGSDAPARLLRGLTPRFAPPAPVAAPEVQGWITPPGFTDLPPVLLKPDGGGVSVPAGSHLTFSLSGGSGVPALRLGERDLPFQQVDAGSFQADADLTEGGRLTVRRADLPALAWDVAVVADAPPEVRWQETPSPARGHARAPAIRLPWQVSHQYGVTGLTAELRLANRPDAPPLVVTIPLPGAAPKSAKGVLSQDLTAHPWAGIAVVGKLVARDAPGLTGVSDDAGFVLPERHFDNPTARDILAVRKALSLWPEERLAATSELDKIARRETIWDRDAGGLLNLSAAIAELHFNRDPAAVDAVQSRLWQLALHLEEGVAERTARALAEARRALKDALEAQKRGEQVDPQEIDKRIAELEKAIQQHMDALAEQLRQDPDAAMQDPDAQKLNAQEAQKQAEQLRQQEQQGQQQDARQTMAELEKTLDQLQSAKPQHKDPKARQRAQKRQKGDQQMSALQDMVKREGALLDRAQTRAGHVPRIDELERLDPDTAARTDERHTDERVQKALRRAVGELMQQYGDLTGDVPTNLGDADTAMRGAIESLGRSDDKRATGQMQAAIAALQKGGESMSEQMAQQFGAPGDQQGDEDGDQGPGSAMGKPQDGQQPGEDNGGQRSRQGRQSFGRNAMGKHGEQRTDPLGRTIKQGEDGTDEAADVMLPEQMEQARTRAIQDELRRREGQRQRPQPELDYIDRLLKQF